MAKDNQQDRLAEAIHAATDSIRAGAATRTTVPSYHDLARIAAEAVWPYALEAATDQLRSMLTPQTSQPNSDMVPLWQFTLPVEANYGQFYLTVKGKTVCFRIERNPDGEIKVVVWAEKPPPIYLDDIVIEESQ
jgi:hypothetical protein